MVVIVGDPDIEIDFVPSVTGVYVNVWGTDEFEKVELVGVNVPPAPLSDCPSYALVREFSSARASARASRGPTSSPPRLTRLTIAAT